MAMLTNTRQSYEVTISLFLQEYRPHDRRGRLFQMYFIVWIGSLDRYLRRTTAGANLGAYQILLYYTPLRGWI
jgi:hypothetical protein